MLGKASLEAQTMVKKRSLNPQPLFDDSVLLPFLHERGIKPVHANTLWSHLLNTPTKEISSIPGLPQAR
jgi:hypothetical protein